MCGSHPAYHLCSQYRGRKPSDVLAFLALSIGFYCYFWKKNSGQTLGMQVWKVRLAQENNLDVSLMRMIYRCLLGLIFTLLFGLNYLPMLFRKDKKTLNDILSKTFLIKV